MQETLLLFHFSNEWFVIITPLICMALDIITGFWKACKQNDVKSTKLRNGLYKKATEILIVLLVEYFQYVLMLQQYQIAAVVSAYVIFMEIISIIENAIALDVPVPSFFLTILHEAQEKIDDGSIIQK